MRKLRVLGALALVAFTLSGLGCGSFEDHASLAGDYEQAPPPQQPPLVIEESDIYRQEGGFLLVQNADTGLNILDVQNPAWPRLVGRAAETRGAAGEMYLREGQALVLLEEQTLGCQNPASLQPQGWVGGAELVMVNTANKSQPRVVARYCLCGSLVDSRIVGDILYVVTTQAGRGSQAISINIADPQSAFVVQQLAFPDASKEILVTAEAIFVAGLATTSAQSYVAQTRVQYIAISQSGRMQARGAFLVEGEPQGRFHMDVAGDQFRIVTFDAYASASRLSILDLSDPDRLRLLGYLPGIGRGERLYATRFAGDKAYVVTFRETDPLWVISLADPSRPVILGELHVPGWSDFIFPRGDRLLTVGRGPGGSYLQVSLFDVSDPHQPRSLEQITLGDYSTTSEANSDHRAVTIIERPNNYPLVVVPHTSYSWGGSCQLDSRLQLVEVAGDRLRVQGVVDQPGIIFRTFLVEKMLYSISTVDVMAVDISCSSSPQVASRVTIGLADGSSNTTSCEQWRQWEEDQQRWEQGCWEGGVCGGGGMYYGEQGPFLCSLGESTSSAPPVSFFALLALGLAALARRRRH